MEPAKYIKYQYFRSSKSWEDMANEVCQWVNVNINVIRIVSITSVLCHINNKAMVNLYYSDHEIPNDILNQTSNFVLTYQVFRNQRTMQHSWRVHNEKMLPGINEISKRGTIVAMNSMQHDEMHKQNVTVVWYKRAK